MKRVTIAADSERNFSHDIIVVLSDALEEKYEVVPKDFPADLPQFWSDPMATGTAQQKEITWISNFGLRRVGEEDFVINLPEGEAYSVEIPLGLGDKYVYFDGQNVQELVGETTDNKFVASLTLGDPPIGSAI